MACYMIAGSGDYHICACSVVGFVLGVVVTMTIMGFIVGLCQYDEEFEKMHNHKRYIPYCSLFPIKKIKTPA